MHRDSLRGLIGRINAQKRQLEALSSALHMIEVMWANMSEEERKKTELASGWYGWVMRITTAVDWP